MAATRRFLPVASAQTVDFFTCYLISKHRDWKASAHRCVSVPGIG
jgi:hypothetical protein